MERAARRFDVVIVSRWSGRDKLRRVTVVEYTDMDEQTVERHMGVEFIAIS